MNAARLAVHAAPKATIGAFHEFWRTMGNPADANAFLSALLKHLNADKTSKSGTDVVLGEHGTESFRTHYIHCCVTQPL